MATNAALCLLNAFIEEVRLNCWKAKASATCLLYEWDPRCRAKSAGWSASTSGAMHAARLSAARRSPATRVRLSDSPHAVVSASGQLLLCPPGSLLDEETLGIPELDDW